MVGAWHLHELLQSVMVRIRLAGLLLDQMAGCCHDVALLLVFLAFSL